MSKARLERTSRVWQQAKRQGQDKQKHLESNTGDSPKRIGVWLYLMREGKASRYWSQTGK